eukprot:CAMPEP_0115844440 /NCGR_PEP_ID=MMETSP0287-20121206/8829_1 /TAXON_ID=412157 /ORGANISM="Chrysochromulina rotalis, Strain UIO044" /LENGTH=35 /DNA_ID= /DNA_START= /DNA_END= /DNA_ORIENTATION=
MTFHKVWMEVMEVESLLTQPSKQLRVRDELVNSDI